MEEGINLFLVKKGVKVNRGWISEALKYHTSNNSNVNQKSAEDFIFEQFLFANLNLIGAGCLPNNISDIQLQTLKGPFVLQVDEIFNIGDSHEKRQV